MCACTETDVRESANDCILASGEGHGSRGETFHAIYAANPVSSSVEHPVHDSIIQPSIHRSSRKPLSFIDEKYVQICVFYMTHPSSRRLST
jgi:hypothetical protein